jgi:hypothetical protein
MERDVVHGEKLDDLVGLQGLYGSFHLADPVRVGLLFGDDPVAVRDDRLDEFVEQELAVPRRASGSLRSPGRL